MLTVCLAATVGSHGPGSGAAMTLSLFIADGGYDCQDAEESRLDLSGYL
jgi:hypothetical protein